MQEEALKYNGPMEDEIDLVDLIRILKKRSKLIIVIFLSITIVSIIVGMSKFKNSKKGTTIISYNFNEISDGLNPDGSNFNPNLISSNEVLNAVIKNIGIENEDLNVMNIRENLTVTPIIPNYIKSKIKSELEQGLKSSFSPSNYEITLKTIIDLETTKTILQTLVIEYKDYYTKRYAHSDMISSLKLDNDYEYKDYLNIAENHLDSIEQIIKSKQNQGYISNQSGISFSSILSRINLIRKVDFTKIDQYLAMEGLHKNKNSVLRELNYEKEKLENKRQKKLNEVEALNEVLKLYKPEKINMKVSGLGERFEKNQTDDYYSTLIKDVASAAVEAGNISQEINYLEKKKKRIVSIKVIDKIEIKKALETLGTNMENLTVVSNRILEEYNNRFITNYIKTTSPVDQVQDKKHAMLIIAIGMTMGLFLGIFAAFIKEFFKTIDK